MDKLAELNFVLEQLGVNELMNIVNNREEVKQLCNKIGRPDLFQHSIEALERTSSDEEEYIYVTSSEDESECSVSDLVEEQFQVNPCGNGFYELQDVEKEP